MSAGYIPEKIRARVRHQAGDRCGYCLSPQWLVLGLLEIEHIIPKAEGGSDDEDNLWQSCRLCNGFKGVQTQAFDPETGQRAPLFDPRRQHWSEHFAWSEDGTQIVGKTPCGRATVIALQLNNLIAVMVRRAWVAAGWHPPRDR
ncbi:MAG TPA: HNH endonuclease [Gemmataceae bacterium]|nr:HNH endonuclease [Gemmataceae bacterium]